MKTLNGFIISGICFGIGLLSLWGWAFSSENIAIAFVWQTLIFLLISFASIIIEGIRRGFIT